MPVVENSELVSAYAAQFNRKLRQARRGLPLGAILCTCEVPLARLIEPRRSPIIPCRTGTFAHLQRATRNISRRMSWVSGQGAAAVYRAGDLFVRTVVGLRRCCVCV